MSERPWIIGAQLSTSHTAIELLTPQRIEEIIGRALALVELQILIVGAREVPDAFAAVMQSSRKGSYETFVWYNLLSDIHDMQPSDMVVNWRGIPSAGWDGWANKNSGTEETFRFVCPNNPVARQKTLSRLEHLLRLYPFDGVFLDKCRFPSPANGIEEMFSCFCVHCREAAARRHLDLDDVIGIFETGAFGEELWAVPPPGGTGHSWLRKLLLPGGLLARFLQFRADSVTGLIADVHALTQRLDRQLSLDLFTASLAPLVGQDYRALSALASWAKPMTYRKALGPASLRLELPALFDGLARFSAAPLVQLEKWAANAVPNFPAGTLAEIREAGVPYAVMTEEISMAVRQLAPTPVYAGIETVSYPGMIDVDPSMVRSMVRAVHAGGAAGAILSWDLMYTPEENLNALKGE